MENTLHSVILDSIKSIVNKADEYIPQHSIVASKAIDKKFAGFTYDTSEILTDDVIEIHIRLVKRKI